MMQSYSCVTDIPVLADSCYHSAKDSALQQNKPINKLDLLKEEFSNY
jgi:hypothetical protein